MGDEERFVTRGEFVQYSASVKRQLDTHEDRLDKLSLLKRKGSRRS